MYRPLIPPERGVPILRRLHQLFPWQGERRIDVGAYGSTTSYSEDDGISQDEGYDDPSDPEES